MFFSYLSLIQRLYSQPPGHSYIIPYPAGSRMGTKSVHGMEKYLMIFRPFGPYSANTAEILPDAWKKCSIQVIPIFDRS